MRNSTAAAIAAGYTPPSPQRVQSAGPCPVPGCGGQLEVRHERQFGKVYTVCAECERRVVEVRDLRNQIGRLTAERDERVSRRRSEVRGTRRGRVFRSRACRRCTLPFTPTGPRSVECGPCREAKAWRELRDQVDRLTAERVEQVREAKA